MRSFFRTWPRSFTTLRFVQGLPLGSTAQWAQGNAGYSGGWALGTVKFVPGSEIQAAYTAGELLPEDILLIDGVSFGSQRDDVSYGRSIDGGGAWQFLENPSPGAPNSAGSDGNSLVINEFMADNNTVLEDPDEAGEWPDWIELFNGSAEPVTLSGLFLTDDLQRPTRWQIPVAVTGPTLRDEIALRLSNYTTYPPADLQALSADLAAIRNLFKNPHVTGFAPDLESTVTDALVSFGFDADKKIRFRSSTNVEDSEQFTGAGLYESYSGSLTSEPIVLTGYFSQSIGGGSHLCPKNFLFEPGLEPGISPQTLSELQSQNIRLIYFTTGARECRPTEWEDTPLLIRFYGFDDPIDGRPCSGR